MRGFEPPRLSTAVPKTAAATVTPHSHCELGWIRTTDPLVKSEELWPLSYESDIVATNQPLPFYINHTYSNDRMIMFHVYLLPVFVPYQLLLSS